VADGIGNILMLGNLADKPDVRNFPFMAIRFQLWQRMLINLTVPFMLLFISTQQLFCWRRETNAIKNPKVEARMSALHNFSIA
jgi:hypothetical protein